MRRDIILITVDCWRADAPQRMSILQEQTDNSGEWVERNAISQAASTMFVFPQILASQYHANLMAVDGPASVENVSIDGDAIPLPELLSKQGYETAGFAASNPNLDIWKDYFDTWRNQDLERFPNASSFVYEIDYYSHLLLQKPRVSAGQIETLARKWFQEQTEPRFCWLHLMEPHSPYYPGIRKALDVGLRDAYRANRRLTRGSTRDLLTAPNSERTVNTLEELYYKTVERLDQQLSSILSVVPDDAIVVLMGDHGEEFHHGWLEHTRLYDECVRVPLYTRNLPLPDDPIRQLDLAPTILDELELPIPDQWTGVSADDTSRPSFLIEPNANELETVFTGVRTNNWKLIEERPLENPQQIETVEFYDLTADPEETAPIEEFDPTADSVREELHEFLAETKHDLDQYGDSPDRAVDESVERRLAELGYR